MKVIKLAILSVCIVSLSNCNPEEDEHNVPPVAVNLNIATNLPQFNDLNFIGGSVWVDGGHNGILLFRPSTEEIKAFDGQAPYEVINRCRIQIDSSGWIGVDTCSGSRWLLSDGQNIEGPAFYPLREYQTFFDGANLNVSN